MPTRMDDIADIRIAAADIAAKVRQLGRLVAQMSQRSDAASVRSMPSGSAQPGPGHRG